jgi:hypothetical protein
MEFSEIFNMILKYILFGGIIFFIATKLPTYELPMKERIYITVAALLFIILIEALGGSFKKLKELLCGCSSPTEAQKKGECPVCPTTCPAEKSDDSTTDDSTVSLVI